MSSLRIIIAGIFALPPLLISVVIVPLVGILSIPSVFLLLSRKFVLTRKGRSTRDAVVVVANDDDKKNDNTDTASNRSSTNDTNTATTNDSNSSAQVVEKQVSPTIVTTKTNINRKQLIITGGSSGIGLAIAKNAAQRSGCDNIDYIYILARDKKKLDKAKFEILAENSCMNTNLIVETISVDVTDSKALQESAKKIMTSTTMNENNDNNDEATVVNMSTHLFICAGEPYPMYIEQVTSTMYANAVAVNQLGSIYTATAFLPYFKKQDYVHNNATITFCSSMCGNIGVYGYAAYSPTKFALRGFAECLFHELISYPNIHVQIAYPPDTDTPGFQTENLTKPVETQLISEQSGLSTSNQIGSIMYTAATCKKPKFNVYFNLDGYLVCTLTSGFSPVTNLWDGISQVCLTSIIRFVSLFYLKDWHTIIYKYQNKSDTEQQQIEQKLFPNRHQQQS